MDRAAPQPRLHEQFQAVMRLHHYSIRTEQAYWYWIRFYIRFTGCATLGRWGLRR